MYWDQLTSPQIATLNRNIPVILPISATEQHGPHLPLATDRMIGEHFCHTLNERIPEQVLVLPIVSVGCSEHHTDFSGSLSVQHTTFLNQLTDMASWVVKYGFKNLLLLNSHGGNQAIGSVFVEMFGFRNPQCRIAMATWWRIATKELKKLHESGFGGIGHAGEFETSLMLLIAPHLVHKDKIGKKANVPTFNWTEGDMLSSSKVGFYRRTKAMTPTGVYGDAAYGSREKGEQITSAVIDELEKIVLDLYGVDDRPIESTESR